LSSSEAKRNGGKKSSEGNPARKHYQTNKAPTADTTGSVIKPPFQVGLLTTFIR
jgi:hypothetical protein